MHASAILFTGVDAVEVGSTDVREPGAGEILVEAVYTCISPGTELRCLAGKQEGSQDWPFIPGYAMAGRVLVCGPDVDLAEGTPVVCGGTVGASTNRLWGGHLSHSLQAAARVFPIPDGVGLLEASIAPLAAIAYHGVRLSRPALLESVAVIGLGPIGQLSARLHALSGARVVGADLSPERVAQAVEAGIAAVVSTGRLAEAVREVLPAGADIVVDCTGAPAVLREAIEVARDVPWDDSATPSARMLVQGSYPADIPVPYQQAFMKELTLLFPRDRQPRDVRSVLDLLAWRDLSAVDLIGDVCAPADAPRVYASLRRGAGPLMTAAFKWSDE